MYCLLMLSQLRFKVRLEAFCVGLGKGDWSRNIEIVKEICDMKEDRVTGLVALAVNRGLWFQKK